MIAMSFLRITAWITAISAIGAGILLIWIWIESWLNQRRLDRMQRETDERWRKQNADGNGEHEYTPKHRARFLP